MTQFLWGDLGASPPQLLGLGAIAPTESAPLLSLLSVYAYKMIFALLHCDCDDILSQKYRYIVDLKTDMDHHYSQALYTPTGTHVL